jgi:hypothetical protein
MRINCAKVFQKGIASPCHMPIFLRKPLWLAVLTISVTVHLISRSSHHLNCHDSIKARAAAGITERPSLLKTQAGCLFLNHGLRRHHA